MQISGLLSQPQVKQRWLAFALLSLLTANVLAIFLVILKTPLIPSAAVAPFFRSLLAYHVNLAMIFWMPSVAIWLWCYFFRLPRALTNSAFVIAIAAIALLLCSLIDADHQVSLSNYYPILHSELFIGALLLQLLACSLVAVAVIVNLGEKSVSRYLYQSAAVTWLLMLVALLANFIAIPDRLAQEQYFEALLWAPGHIQQTVNALLITAMWSHFFKVDKALPLLRASVILAVGSCIIALVLSFILNDALMKRQVFTLQMSLASWLPLLIVGCHFFKQRSQQPYILWSLAVAVLGLIAGFMIDRGTLGVPGHYHGMTGAFNMAFFAIIIVFSTHRTRYQNVLSLLYGLGIVLLIIGLMWAGELGIGRKLISHQQGELSLWQLSALTFIVSGATLAVITSLFVIKNFLSKLKATKTH